MYEVAIYVIGGEATVVQANKNVWVLVLLTAPIHETCTMYPTKYMPLHTPLLE